jgi:hypothetical protein
MFFNDEDLHDGLKLSLDALTQLTKQEKDPVNKRKCATALAEIILSLIKMQSDKEDWRFLMQEEKPNKDIDEEDNLEF